MHLIGKLVANPGILGLFHLQPYPSMSGRQFLPERRLSTGILQIGQQQFEAVTLTNFTLQGGKGGGMEAVIKLRCLHIEVMVQSQHILQMFAARLG
ncbi:hypothetical protein D3C72_1895410 [compost metagenome]